MYSSTCHCQHQYCTCWPILFVIKLIRNNVGIFVLVNTSAPICVSQWLVLMKPILYWVQEWDKTIKLNSLQLKESKVSICVRS